MERHSRGGGRGGSAGRGGRGGETSSARSPARTKAEPIFFSRYDKSATAARSRRSEAKDAPASDFRKSPASKPRSPGPSRSAFGGGAPARGRGRDDLRTRAGGGGRGGRDRQTMQPQAKRQRLSGKPSPSFASARSPKNARSTAIRNEASLKSPPSSAAAKKPTRAAPALSAEEKEVWKPLIKALRNRKQFLLIKARKRLHKLEERDLAPPGASPEEVAVKRREHTLAVEMLTKDIEDIKTLDLQILIDDIMARPGNYTVEFESPKQEELARKILTSKAVLDALDSIQPSLAAERRKAMALGNPEPSPEEDQADSEGEEHREAGLSDQAASPLLATNQSALRKRKRDSQDGTSLEQQAIMNLMRLDDDNDETGGHSDDGVVSEGDGEQSGEIDENSEEDDSDAIEGLEGIDFDRYEGMIAFSDEEEDDDEEDEGPKQRGEFSDFSGSDSDDNAQEEESSLATSRSRDDGAEEDEDDSDAIEGLEGIDFDRYEGMLAFSDEEEDDDEEDEGPKQRGEFSDFSGSDSDEGGDYGDVDDGELTGDDLEDDEDDVDGDEDDEDEAEEEPRSMFVNSLSAFSSRLSSSSSSSKGLQKKPAAPQQKKPTERLPPHQRPGVQPPASRQRAAPEPLARGQLRRAPSVADEVPLDKAKKIKNKSNTQQEMDKATRRRNTSNKGRVHISWILKKRQREKQANTTFQGKRIVFAG